MLWAVQGTEEFQAWFVALPEDERDDLRVVIGLLRIQGPLLGRPHADTLRHTRLHRLKELRSGTLRVIFAFDPTRTAVLLLGGDKAGQWARWYRQAIPQAERLYEAHLRASGEGD